MIKKNEKNTKGKIINAAWDLFYEQGYENTTVEDIIFEYTSSCKNKTIERVDFLAGDSLPKRVYNKYYGIKRLRHAAN